MVARKEQDLLKSQVSWVPHFSPVKLLMILLLTFPCQFCRQVGKALLENSETRRQPKANRAVPSQLLPPSQLLLAERSQLALDRSMRMR